MSIRTITDHRPAGQDGHAGRGTTSLGTSIHPGRQSRQNDTAAQTEFVFIGNAESLTQVGEHFDIPAMARLMRRRGVSDAVMVGRRFSLMETKLWAGAGVACIESADSPAAAMATVLLERVGLGARRILLGINDDAEIAKLVTNLNGQGIQIHMLSREGCLSRKMQEVATGHAWLDFCIRCASKAGPQEHRCVSGVQATATPNQELGNQFNRTERSAANFSKLLAHFRRRHSDATLTEGIAKILSPQQWPVRRADQPLTELDPEIRSAARSALLQPRMAQAVENSNVIFAPYEGKLGVLSQDSVDVRGHPLHHGDGSTFSAGAARP